MSQQNTSMLLLKKRLTEWGQWSYYIETAGLSYSAESIFMQLAREQGVLDMSASEATLFCERVEEIELLIERMVASVRESELSLHWVKVIRINYTRPHDSFQSKVQLSHFNERRYCRYLHDAHEWLAAALLSSSGLPS